MQSTGLRRAVVGVAAAAMGLLAGAAQAALQDRDLNGDTVTDAFYDTDLKITWLRDANARKGYLPWFDAVAWVDSFSFGGYSDWRLPTSDTCEGWNCTGSEMGHLWHTELGNKAGFPMTNTGDFQNLVSGAYWSGTPYAPYPNKVWSFLTDNGLQTTIFSDNSSYAMVVRDGDVAAVPEPETYALMLAGLAAVALVARRRSR